MLAGARSGMSPGRRKADAAVAWCDGSPWRRRQPPAGRCSTGEGTGVASVPWGVAWVGSGWRRGSGVDGRAEGRFLPGVAGHVLKKVKAAQSVPKHFCQCVSTALDSSHGRVTLVTVDFLRCTERA